MPIKPLPCSFEKKTNQKTTTTTTTTDHHVSLEFCVTQGGVPAANSPQHRPSPEETHLCRT